MSYKPIIIILGEPYSVFIEIFLKSYKNFILKKYRVPIILVGSFKLLKNQMRYFGYKFKINIIKEEDIDSIKNNNMINIIDVPYKFKKIFEKDNKYSNEYIEKTFIKSIQIIKHHKILGLINGPVSKKKFLKKKYEGITEYLAYLTSSINTSMLIYNEKFSVSPLTTHIPLKKVVKKINKSLIIKKVQLLNKFYNQKLKVKPKIAVLGLNPHCETTDDFSEERNILSPAIKFLRNKKIRISGPYPADTFFLKSNYIKYNLIIGMYHDQVLTPIKTLYEFNAINITVGLPFIRISPDHGPNEKMVSKGKSSNLSLIKSLKFFSKKNVIKS